MNSGRTYWWGKDCGWWRREWIVDLGEEFGAGGPAVIDWLSCEARAQDAGGYVKAGPRSVARGCFVDVVTVGHVLSRAVTLGLLEEYEESEGRFTCRISGWKADQDKSYASSRKAKQRAEEAENTRGLPSLSRSVTECPPTEQNRTEQKENNSNVELKLDKAREHAKHVTELFGYWQERCGHPQAKLTADRRSRIKARLAEGYTVEQIRHAIDGAAVGAKVNDETGTRYDDIELICRKGSKLEDFMARTATVGRARPQSRRGQVIAAQDAWKAGYDNDGQEGQSA